MNKNKLSKVLSVFFGGVLAFGMVTSCTAGFEEANRPGEFASGEELGRDNYNTGNFLIQMQNSAFPEQENAYQMTQDLIGNTMGRFMTYANNGWNSANFATMNAPLGWVGYPFSDTTPKVVSAFNEVARITNKSGLGYAWALILRAQAFLRLTDMYGPFPIGAEENPQAYSTQEKVYKSLIADLDAALTTLNGMAASNGGMLVAYEETDKVYGGDFSKWIKFANSLKLRMAVRMRFVEPDYAKQVGEAAVAAGVLKDNGDNCAITFVPNGLYKVSVEWGDSRVCADLESYMTGYQDARMAKYFLPTKTEGARPFIGCRSGAAIGNKDTAGKLYSAANVSREDRGMWMTAAEMTFCRAEGALAGWSGMGGSVEELYNKAIALSFEQWGVSGADSYIANEELTPADYNDADGGYGAPFSALSNLTVKWDNDATEEQQMERLIIQKWIALFPDGQEGWNEIRRTGYPKVSPLAQSSSNGLNVANRIPFNNDEKINNAANYADAVQKLGGADDYTTKMWWQKK